MSQLPDRKAYARHCQWMAQALECARAAGEAGEVPVGAIVVDASGTPLARAGNRKERDRDPTAHAEVLAIRAASQHQSSWRLVGCSLYVTLEPCPMCAGAIIQARLARLVYGADDPSTGAIRTAINLPDSAASQHNLADVSGICETASRDRLQAWFAQKRRGSV
jgi:tRNA(adenine34) deaminase